MYIFLVRRSPNSSESYSRIAILDFDSPWGNWVPPQWWFRLYPRTNHRWRIIRRYYTGNILKLPIRTFRITETLVVTGSYINCGFLCIYAVFKNVLVIIFIDKANSSLGSVSIVAFIRTSICIKIRTVIIYNTYVEFPYSGLQFQVWDVQPPFLYLELQVRRHFKSLNAEAEVRKNAVAFLISGQE